ncbi:plastocyanin/azurin family copper-binding protein [Halorussus sp. MSC15.2]|uniref:plastocyanin/azurin family copper-binding protein n=1 Tax=Halorussus sp. MSC15.2 TaxID=2283638 RepID=UPI0013D1A12E|nr:plastocyanin/azurin family copper-binding protein [Halorussus sp. MSC15.2]NEU57091.1 halocyanin [Halorussus sp. MSC15.2]
MRRRTFLSAVSAVGVGGLAGCNAPTGGTETELADGTGTTAGGGSEAETTAGGETATEQETQGGATETVQMVTEGSEYYFDPIGLFVESGDTVEWVIESGAHSSTAYAQSLDSADVTRIPEQAEPWNSGILTSAGASFSYTFEVTGTYDYFCIPHKALGMIARIVCGEPGDVEGDPPDGDVPAEQAIVEQGAISYSEFSG